MAGQSAANVAEALSSSKGKEIMYISSNDEDDYWAVKIYILATRRTFDVKIELTFEVVTFKGAYHALLVRPFFAKFMSISNYVYLQLKISGKGDITVHGSILHTYTCDRELANRRLSAQGKGGQVKGR